MSAKIVVIYPKPADAAEFERAYTEDHAPMVTPDAFPGITKFVQVKVLGTADGSEPQFARIAELHFNTIDDLKNTAGSPGAAPVVAHANEISTGGAPIVLVTEETTTTFGGQKAATS
jgi:uncharacterized protein (TIGR02118 family)